jgi:hypothetical protein
VKVKEEALKRLDLLAGKLGVVSEQLWATLILQQRVDVIVNLVWLSGCGYGIWWLGRAFRSVRESHDAFDSGMAQAGCVIGIGILAIFGCFGLRDILIGILNPEFGALKEILRALSH